MSLRFLIYKNKECVLWNCEKISNAQRFSIIFLSNLVYNHSFKNLDGTHFEKSIRKIQMIVLVADFLER